MKKILSLILILTLFVPLYADDMSWKMHPIFDEEVTHVVETPDYVYFTSRNVVKNSSQDVYESLFRYDKKGEELISLSASNILNGYVTRNLAYNAEKGYLLVVYHDFNIDLLHNNGKVTNIPYYEKSDLSMSKSINSISPDASLDRVYFATDFGYVAINDKKNEIAESRLYGEPLSSFVRLGDDYLAIKDKNLVSAPVSSPRLSLNDYEFVEYFNYPTTLYSVGENIGILLSGDTDTKAVMKLTKDEEGYHIEDLFTKTICNVDYTAGGLNITTNDVIYQMKPDGSVLSLARPAEYSNSAAGSQNMSDIWVGLKRKGLCSIRNAGEQWSITRDWMLPNAPSQFASTSFLNHPDKGFMMVNSQQTPPTSKLYSHSPLHLSSYNSGRWKNYGPAYTNPGRTSFITGPNGMALDPDNRSYVYVTSFHKGFARLNLNDPSDIIHISPPGDSDSNNPGYTELPGFPVNNRSYSNLSTPYFDKQGNLWMTLGDWDQTINPKVTMYCWESSDRKAASISNIPLPKKVVFDAYCPASNLTQVLPLQKTGSSLLVFVGCQFEELIYLIDTKGTPTDTSDDKIYSFGHFIDSDGNSVDIRQTNYIWEDPATGYVWVCHANGVCYFIPSQVISGNTQVYRVKVPRNDGTNLADYLLEGVSVNHVVADSEGRKWFSTAGAGIICTSSDGREIIEEFNVSNSPLPDDVVYAIGYDSGDNSLMISTDKGFAEYSLPASQSSSTKEDVRAYPNPVRPEYSGYVTITDIPQGSFVKIVDSSGNLVKELGIVSGFDILWDLSDSRFTRVRSGVYYIMISPSDETSHYSTVGKILVIS